MQFPAIIGGVVPIVNLEGIAPGAAASFTGPVLADIYLGKIKKWNDKAIADLNPGVKLPADPITVVRRSDGSGTTFLWTDYLSKVSPEWKTKVGAEHGGVVAGRRRRQGQRRRGRLRAADQGLDRLRRVRVREEEQDGVRARCRTATASSCSPTTTTFQAAAAGADWKGTPGFGAILTDQPGKTSWPITGATLHPDARRSRTSRRTPPR